MTHSRRDGRQGKRGLRRVASRLCDETYTGRLFLSASATGGSYHGTRDRFEQTLRMEEVDCKARR